MVKITMAFVNNFLNSLTIPVGELAKWLEREHNIPLEVTISKWNTITGINVVIEEDKSFSCENVDDQTINIKTGNADTTNLCQHVFKVGPRKGQQCTTKTRNGSEKCGAHKKVASPKEKKAEKNSEKKSKKEKKEPTNKKFTSPEFVPTSDSESETSEPITKKNGEKKPTKVVKKKIPYSDSEHSDVSENDEDEFDLKF